MTDKTAEPAHSPDATSTTPAEARGLRVRIPLLIALALLLGTGGCSDQAVEGSTGGSNLPPVDQTVDDATTTTGIAATTTPPSGDRVEIRWFADNVYGAGPSPFEPIAKEFNSTYGPANNIELIIEQPDGAFTPSLQSRIADGNAPDLAGPMGIMAAAQLFGGWLDIAPYLDGHDLSDFDPNMLDLWKQDGVQVGLPLYVHPQVLWYNKDLFDAAGLTYPPQEFDAPYVDADGNEKPWNLDTLRELAMELTVDSNGLAPTDEGFDPSARVQWGFGNQWADFRGIATLFGAGNFVAEDNKTCLFPQHWKTAANWYRDAIWKDYFHPDDSSGEGVILGSGNWFDSGNIAMITNHTWYAGWGTEHLAADFDVAAIPAGPDGAITAKLHSDTLLIPKGTKHPDEAVEVLLWMMSRETVPRLPAYVHRNGLRIPDFPARTSAQQVHVTDPANDFGFTWDVVLDALNYPDVPNHEAWLPAYQESTEAVENWWTELASNPNSDVEAAIDQLCDILQPIWDSAT